MTPDTYDDDDDTAFDPPYREDDPAWDGENDCPFCEGMGCGECDYSGDYSDDD